MVLPQDKFTDLVNMVLTTTWYTFNSKFYQQIDGIAMRESASSTIAEINMQAHEQTTLSTTFHHVNNLRQNFKFPMVKESNGELAFLNIYKITK